MQPLISIITVTKDCNSTIDRTLKSIQSIKDTDIQFIVIDGKSVDGTLLNIERYENLVDILVSEDDTGIYNAMNGNYYSLIQYLTCQLLYLVSCKRNIDLEKNLKLLLTMIFFFDYSLRDIFL